ncbi:MAG: hypothetical protein AAFY15_15255 [Cyanobacteria bacterium J06648_11]
MAVGSVRICWSWAMKMGWLAIALGVMACPAIAIAGEADVVEAEVRAVGDGTYRFDVTVAHADTGWDHYANSWEVLAPDGTVLGTRVLHHPHVQEQPFTRSTTIAIPDEIDRVIIRAGDSVHEFGGKTIELDIPAEQPVTP